jgi:hypothetical protein
LTAGLERALALTTESHSRFWTQRYLLLHCDGYMVDGPDGHVGFVSEVVESDGEPELVVETGAGELRVPMGAIERFDPSAERLRVGAAATSRG